MYSKSSFPQYSFKKGYLFMDKYPVAFHLESMRENVREAHTFLKLLEEKSYGVVPKNWHTLPDDKLCMEACHILQTIFEDLEEIKYLKAQDEEDFDLIN